MLANLKLTDMETYYKAFRREVLRNFNFESDWFGWVRRLTLKPSPRSVHPFRQAPPRVVSWTPAF